MWRGPEPEATGANGTVLGVSTPVPRSSIQDIYLVGTQVDAEDVHPVEVGEDLVRVWPLLAARDWGQYHCLHWGTYQSSGR